MTKTKTATYDGQKVFGIRLAAGELMPSRVEVARHLSLQKPESKTYKKLSLILYRMLSAKERHALRLLVLMGPMEKNRSGFDKSFEGLLEVKLATRICKAGGLTHVGANDFGYEIFRQNTAHLLRLNHEL